MYLRALATFQVCRYCTWTEPRDGGGGGEKGESDMPDRPWTGKLELGWRLLRANDN